MIASYPSVYPPTIPIWVFYVYKLTKYTVRYLPIFGGNLLKSRIDLCTEWFAQGIAFDLMKCFPSSHMSEYTIDKKTTYLGSRAPAKAS